jgi:hypothetical protein
MAKNERDLDKERFWREVLARQSASGLSGRAFCRRERLSEPAFYAWRRTIGERDRQAKQSPRPAFLPVVVPDHSRHGQAIVIELAGGRALRLSESIAAERLAELVHALEVEDSSAAADLRPWRAEARR